jgi:2-oxoglutarate dehydrogenase E1 component
MINPDNLVFVEQVYQAYREDPASVDADWKIYFDQQQMPSNGVTGFSSEPSFTPNSLFAAGGGSGNRGASVSPGVDIFKQERVDQLIRAFRVRGHRIAKLDPLGRQCETFSELELGHYGLSESDLDLEFSADSVGCHMLKLREILDMMRSTYCKAIGVQYMHIDDPEPKFWLQEKMEKTRNKRDLSRDMQVRILTRLTDAAMFEEFLAKKYVGAKRFGLEGGESLIPLLDLAFEQAGDHGVNDIVMGMAHRGRLNVMANIMGKSPALVFREFEDADPQRSFGRGDVKYHLGLASKWVTESGRDIDLTLCFNPSHLEFVGPVVLGRVRGRQDRLTENYTRVMGVILHGDAAFAGQGVVQEMLNMSEIPGFRTGGTLHIILNNQIGFTTDPSQSRSSHYATDVAKMLQIPIFHVNGEDPEAVAQATWLAMEFRHQFNKDVVIDMYCFRKHGHNEGDDPTVTQPSMYRKIRSKVSVREAYLQRLVSYGEITEAQAEAIALQRRQSLEEELERARDPEFDYQAQQEQEVKRGLWSSYRGGPDANVPDVKTTISQDAAKSLLENLARVPDDFACHPKTQRLVLQRRLEAALGEKPLDWGTAENLAFASLLAEGHNIRLTGQDVGRGTFSHRHAILHDYENDRQYIPLNFVSQNQARFQVWNSPLTETAMLGFEFGFCLDSPDNLVVWEAQFGDFANVGQVIFDQFISSSEDKWNKLNHLVMLLPHGFEGQGPEHSSARLERFLQIAAEDNICVVNLTTPAQLFHCFRRQIHRAIRKPLVVMSPKSLLRHPDCVSSLAEITRGAFHRVIPDQQVPDQSQVKRILLCSGKVYYDLDAYRRETNRDDVAIVRAEQLYPFPGEDLKTALSPYGRGTPVIWVQEEPENMGALNHMRLRFGDSVYDRFPFLTISRPESSSPATGSSASHKIEQQGLIEQAFYRAVPGQI